MTPRLLPPPQCYVPQSSAIIPTESTNFVDSDEALSSGRVDFPADLSVHDPGYSSNPQLLRTQPVKKIATPVPMHMHTRSYDMMYMNPPLYLMQGAYPQYYPPQTYYEQSAMVPMEEESYYMPTPAYMPWTEKKGGRRRNPEKEEEKARFTISLESILEGRDTRTTLMIKNIPNKYNQRMLLSEIDERHKFQYDFFYLPIDFIVCLLYVTLSNDFFRIAAMLDTHSSTSYLHSTFSGSTRNLMEENGTNSTLKRQTLLSIN